MATILSLPGGIKEWLPVAIIMSTLQLLCFFCQVRGCFAILGRMNLGFISVYLDFICLNLYKSRGKMWFRYCRVVIRVSVRPLMVEFF